MREEAWMSEAKMSGKQTETTGVEVEVVEKPDLTPPATTQADDAPKGGCFSCFASARKKGESDDPFPAWFLVALTFAKI
jgi:hypothetical protein